MNGRRLARHTLYNLVGLGAPMVVAVVATPLLIAGFGTERFGVLTIIWGVIGYFNLFDLGIGMAMTQLVAERIGNGREDQVPAITWTGILLMILFGTVGALLLAALCRPLATGILQVPLNLQDEAVQSFYLLAFSLPFVTSVAGLRGVLEATQQFGLVNAIRIPMGLFTFLAPLVTLAFSTSLAPAVAALVVGRVVAWLVHLVACLRTIPSLRQTPHIERSVVGRLLRFGGWTSISNLASTIIGYLDRFLIGATVSMAAVSYYVTPFELTWRLTMIPGALVTVVYPAIAANFTSNRARITELFDWSVRIIFGVMFPLTLLLITFAADILQLWLGSEFALHSTAVLQWLAVSMFMISFAVVAAVGLQGMGRPDLPGRFNLVELPLYAALLWWLLREYGIEGAAVAWMCRTAINAVALSTILQRLARDPEMPFRRLALMVIVALPAFASAAMMQRMEAKLLFVMVLLPAFAFGSWHYLLAGRERALIRTWLAAATARSS